MAPVRPSMARWSSRNRCGSSSWKKVQRSGPLLITRNHQKIKRYFFRDSVWLTFTGKKKYPLHFLPFRLTWWLPVDPFDRFVDKEQRMGVVLPTPDNFADGLHLGIAFRMHLRPTRSIPVISPISWPTGHAQVMKIRRPAQRTRNIICGSRLGKRSSHHFMLVVERSFYASELQEFALLVRGSASGNWLAGFLIFLLYFRILSFWFACSTSQSAVFEVPRIVTLHDTRDGFEGLLTQLAVPERLDAWWLQHMTTTASRTEKWVISISVCYVPREVSRRNFRVGNFRQLKTIAEQCMVQ